MPNRPSIAPIAPLHGEFASAPVEAQFLQAQAGPLLRDLRRSLLFCAVFYPLFALADLANLGVQPKTFVLLVSRLLVAAAALAILQYVRHSREPVAAVFRGATAFKLYGMASFFLIVILRPHDTLVHGISMVVLLAIIYNFIPNRLVNDFAIGVGATAVFLPLACHLAEERPGRLISMTMLLLFANLFGALTARRHARLWREQYWAQQVLTNLSMRDPLTGCFNRHHLNAALLDREIARARRYRLPLALVMCDLDDFKIINDTYGHDAGDQLLRDFARLLQDMTREEVDTVVRYGGEEFLILLPETRLEGAVELAERLRAAFAASRHARDDVAVGTTASFGVVGADFSRDHAVTPQALIALADELMYEAKRSGRNQVRSRLLAPQPTVAP
jgi:diguanylate cyclase (GGDEF)-like protein